MSDAGGSVDIDKKYLDEIAARHAGWSSVDLDVRWLIDRVRIGPLRHSWDDLDRGAAIERCKIAWLEHWNEKHAKVGKEWGGLCCIEMAVDAVLSPQSGR